MAAKKVTTADYYIKPRTVTFAVNDKGEPNRVLVGVAYRATISVFIEKIIPLNEDKEHQQWTLQGYSTNLGSNAKYFIYARLNRADSTAMIVFSVNDYQVDENEIYYYIPIGTLTETDGTTPRELSFDSGKLSTPDNSYTKAQADEQFVSFEIADKRFLNALEDDTAQGLINFEKGIRFNHLLLSLEGDDTLYLTNVLTGERANFAASGSVATKGIGASGGGGGSTVPWSQLVNDLIPKNSGELTIGTDLYKFKAVYSLNGYFSDLSSKAIAAESIKLNGKDVATKAYVDAMVAQGGGGGGTGGSSTVSFLPTIESGKEIGTLIIDGLSYSIYAPNNYAWEDITGAPDFATKSFVTTQGYITSGSLGALAFKDNLTFAEIVNTPTTLSGYGITDALSSNGGVITTNTLGGLVIQSSNSKYSVIKFQNNEEAIACGYLGFDTANSPIFMNTNGTSFGLIHKGNIENQSVAAANKLISQYVGDLNSAEADRFFTSGFQATNRPPTGNYATGISLYNSELKYKYQLAFETYGTLHTRYLNSNNAWSDWKQIAYTDSDISGNAATATYATSAGDTSKLGGILAENYVKSTNESKNTFLNYTNHVYFQTAFLSGDGDFCSLVVPTWISNKEDNYYLGELRFKVGNQWGENILYRTSHNGEATDWKTIAFTSSTVAAANKLSTTRTIWGQSFDGSANVSGHLYLGYNSIYGASGENALAVEQNRLSVGYGFRNSKLALYGNIIQLYRGEVESLRINESGNITIGLGDSAGTTAKLYIDGSLKSTGAITIANTTYGIGNTGIMRGAKFISEGDLEVSGATTLHGYTTINNSLEVASTIRIGNILVEDKDGVLYVNGSLAASGAVATKSLGSSSSGGGGSATVAWSALENDMIPKDSDKFNIGSSSKKWNNVYAITGSYSNLSASQIGAQSITLNGYNVATENFVTSRGYAIASSLGSLATKDSLSFAELTSKPTTLAGYGITDAFPLRGGAIIGTSGSLLTLDRTDGNPYIQFNHNGEYVGRYGFNKDTYDPIVHLADATTQTVLHASNYSKYALPLSGGIMSGYISWNSNNDSNGNDVKDWAAERTSFGLRIISSAGSSNNVPTSYATALHVRGRYGFQLASEGGTIDNFFIKNISAADREWKTLIHNGNIGNYALPLSGGVIKGEDSYQQYILTLNTDNAYYTILRFQSQGTDKGVLMWSNDGSSSSFRGFGLKNNTTGDRLGLSDEGVPFYNANTLIHSGNYSVYALPLYGGTISGRLIISSTYDGKLILNETGSDTKFQYIAFQNGGVDYGLLGTFGDDNLKWNGQMIIHSDNYSDYVYSKSDVDERFLSKGGGTINGTVTTPLTLNTTATAEVGLRLSMSGASKGWLGYTPNIGVYMYSYGTGSGDHKLGLSDAGVGFLDSYTLIHSGNIGSQSVASATKATQDGNGNVIATTYLPLIGGILRGAIYLNYWSSQQANIRFINNRIGSSGYADEILAIYDSSSNNVGALGLCGNSEGVQYYYLGHNSYGENNLRVYKDKVTFGNATFLHEGNYYNLISKVKSADYATSAGNADTLDSYHRADIIDYWAANETIGFDLNTIKSYTALQSAYWAYVGSANVSNQPWSNSAANVWTLPGLYPLQIARFYNSNDIRVRGNYGENWYDWKQIAFTDSTVAAANKLVDADGKDVIHDAGHTFYIGDTLYETKPTNLLGKYIVLRYGTSATYGLMLNESGNVTIGSSDLAGSTYKLYVNGNAIYKDAILADRYNGQGNTAGASLMINKGGDFFGIGPSASNVSNISIGITSDAKGTWKSEIATITDKGNVGIGTTSPSVKLHVNGNVTVGDILNIGTASEGTILLNRPSSNYIWANKEGGTLIFGVKDVGGTGSQNASLWIQGDYITPGTRNNAVFLGSTNYRWKNVCSVLGNFSGDVTVGGALSIGGTTRTKNVFPTEGNHNKFDIGASNNQYRYIYGGWIGSGTGEALSFGANNGYGIYVNTYNNVTIGSSDLATTNYKLYVNGSLGVSGNTTIGGTLTINGVKLEAIDGVLYVNGAIAASGPVATKGIGQSSGGGGGTTIAWSNFANSILPQSTSYTLGDSSHKWGGVYADSATLNRFIVTSAKVGETNNNWSITHAGAASFSGVKVNGNDVATVNSVASSLSNYLPIAGGNINGDLSMYGTYTRFFGTNLYGLSSGSGSTQHWSISNVGAASFASLKIGNQNAATQNWVSTNFATNSESVINYFVHILGDRAVAPSIKLDNTIGVWEISNSPNDSWTPCVQMKYGDLIAFSLDTNGYMEIAGTLSQHSDITKKNIISYVPDVTIKDIAQAPICYFTWKDRKDDTKHLGTIAQYWNDITPECVRGEEGNMSMDYSTIALVSSVINAREITKHEDEIEVLKKRVRELEDEVERLRA